jgi:hypothetical protein
MKEDLTTIRTTLKETQLKLLARANVVAAGIGYKITEKKKTSDLSIVCSVTEKLPTSDLSSRDLVPPTFNDIPTDVVETGRIRALVDRTKRIRPAPGGVSIGHREITAGTLGCLVKREGQTLILSNNHVLANSNDASPGDAILQPGPYDGGDFPLDRIANLHEFVPIVFSEGDGDCGIGQGVAALLSGIAKLFRSKTRLRAVSIQAEENLVDAAIALPFDEEDVSPEILEIGTINGLVEGELGMGIKKSGRTTAVTTGEILQVDVTVDVQYGGGLIARFTDQLMAGAMSQGGDSGSTVLDNENNLTGLLFAGSDTSTVINRIQNVFDALGLSL